MEYITRRLVKEMMKTREGSAKEAEAKHEEIKVMISYEDHDT